MEIQHLSTGLWPAAAPPAPKPASPHRQRLAQNNASFVAPAAPRLTAAPRAPLAPPCQGTQAIGLHAPGPNNGAPRLLPSALAADPTLGFDNLEAARLRLLQRLVPVSSPLQGVITPVKRLLAMIGHPEASKHIAVNYERCQVMRLRQQARAWWRPVLPPAAFVGDDELPLYSELVALVELAYVKERSAKRRAQPVRGVADLLDRLLALTAFDGATRPPEAVVCERKRLRAEAMMRLAHEQGLGAALGLGLALWSALPRAGLSVAQLCAIAREGLAAAEACQITDANGRLWMVRCAQLRPKGADAEPAWARLLALAAERMRQAPDPNEVATHLWWPSDDDVYSALECVLIDGREQAGALQRVMALPMPSPESFSAMLTALIWVSPRWRHETLTHLCALAGPGGQLHHAQTLWSVPPDYQSEARQAMVRVSQAFGLALGHARVGQQMPKRLLVTEWHHAELGAPANNIARSLLDTCEDVASQACVRVLNAELYWQASAPDAALQVLTELLCSPFHAWPEVVYEFWRACDHIENVALEVQAERRRQVFAALLAFCEPPPPLALHTYVAAVFRDPIVGEGVVPAPLPFAERLTLLQRTISKHNALCGDGQAALATLFDLAAQGGMQSGEIDRAMAFLQTLDGASLVRLAKNMRQVPSLLFMLGASATLPSLLGEVTHRRLRQASIADGFGKRRSEWPLGEPSDGDGTRHGRDDASIAWLRDELHRRSDGVAGGVDTLGPVRAREVLGQAARRLASLSSTVQRRERHRCAASPVALGQSYADLHQLLHDWVEQETDWGAPTARCSCPATALADAWRMLEPTWSEAAQSASTPSPTLAKLQQSADDYLSFCVLACGPATPTHISMQLARTVYQWLAAAI